MNIEIITANFCAPPICKREIFRYAGCENPDIAAEKLLLECIEETRNKLNYKVCFCELPVNTDGYVCDFGLFSVSSESLSKNLSGCSRTILFAATVGIEFDRLIAKQSRISPSKALMLQALGSERAEALCNAFCDELQKDKKIKFRPRFSPGYGDLSLDVQKEIFSVLNCSKKIGLYLNDSLIMSPTKSVTAFVGITDHG